MASHFVIYRDLQHAPRSVDGRIRHFYQRFVRLYRNEAHFELVCHAAFPIALTPDLIYAIRANFPLSDIEEAPYEAVSDILLSSLCREVRPGLFEMEKSVREYLIHNLKTHPAYGENRLAVLAKFLLAYANIYYTSKDLRKLRESQRLTAMAYLDPQVAAREIVGALNDRRQRGEFGELNRISGLVDALEIPLAGLPELVRYSKALRAVAAGQPKIARRHASQIMFAYEKTRDQDLASIDIAGARLIVDERLKRWIQIITREKTATEIPETPGTEETLKMEGKVVLLGKPGVGKYTLARMLVDPDEEIDRSTTDGIDIFQWRFTNRNGDKKQQFDASVWDFGSQIVNANLYRLFLRQGALYLIVVDDRWNDSPQDLFHWLDDIHRYADRSGALIVYYANHNKRLSLDIKEIRNKYPFVKDLLFIHPEADRKTIDDFRETIKNHLFSPPAAGYKFPESWLAARRKIEELASDRNVNYIDRREYLSVCREYKLDEQSALQLSRLLHDLGLLIHFQDDLSLESWLFLNPTWLAEIVSQVFYMEEIRHNNGRFTYEDIARDQLAQPLIPALLSLLEKFEWCYRLPEAEPETFLIPQLLPKQAPGYYAPEENYPVRRIFSYQFLPADLINRLIVRMRPYWLETDSVWQSGVLLRRGESAGRIIVNRSARTIGVGVKGPDRLLLMAFIREEMAQLSVVGRSNLEVEERTPCNCSVCNVRESPYLYDYKSLIEKSERNMDTVECPVSLIPVDIKNLLEGAQDASFADRERIESGQFYTQKQIFDLVGQYGELAPDEKTQDALLIFSTQQQQTWMVTTNKRLFCLLDDDETIRTGSVLQWDADLQTASKISVKSRYNDNEVGLLDVGPNKNWLYSIKLFPEPYGLKIALRQLIERGLNRFRELPLLHQYAVDRVEQVETFELALYDRDDQGPLFFFMYGEERQSTSGLFRRLAYDASGQLLNWEQKPSELKLASFEISIVESRSIALAKTQLIRSILAATSVSIPTTGSLSNFKLNSLISSTPVLNEMGANDYFFLHIRWDEFNWNAQITPELIRWFISEFCGGELPADAPQVIFFFSVEFEEENTEIKLEIQQYLAEKIKGLRVLPELGMVSRRDLEEWFARYSFIVPSNREIQEIIEKHFGKESEFYMEDVEIRLARIIEDFNKGGEI